MVKSRLLFRMAAVLSVVVLTAGIAGAQDEKKKKKGGDRAPFGLPSVAVLKEKLSLNEDQQKQVSAVYKEYAAKDKELAKEAKSNPDQKKEIGKKRKGLRDEVIAKLLEITDDEQDKTLNELVKPAAKKGKKKKPADQ